MWLLSYIGNHFNNNNNKNAMRDTETELEANKLHGTHLKRQTPCSIFKALNVFTQHILGWSMSQTRTQKHDLLVFIFSFFRWYCLEMRTMMRFYLDELNDDFKMKLRPIWNVTCFVGIIKLAALILLLYAFFFLQKKKKKKRTISVSIHSIYT